MNKSGKKILKQASVVNKFVSVFENLVSKLQQEVDYNEAVINEAKVNIKIANDTIKRVNKIIGGSQ